MKDIKKQLLNEFNSRTPKMSDELKNYPITTSVKKSRMPRFSFYMLGALACLIVIAVILPLALKENPGTKSCYLFEVNPSVLVFTDESGDVTEIKSGNEDADELLVGIKYESLIGENINDVSITLVDTLIQLGYFDSNSYENIMKISTLNSNVDIQKVISDYTSSCGYFVAVLEDELSFEVFNEVFDSSVSNMKQLEEYLDSIFDLKIDNESNNIDYKKEYKDRYLSQYLNEVVFSDLEKLNNVEDCLIELNEIYDSISEKTFLKDYWIVKSFYASNPDSMEDELKVLMDRMDELLTAYNDLTNNVILSGPELKMAYASVLAIPTEEIELIASTLNEYLHSEEYENKIKSLVEFFKLIDKESAELLEEYSKLPDNLAEFKSRVKNMHSNNYNSRKKNYENSYNEVKEAISSDKYNNYLAELIEKYGSLENFWKNK